MWINVHPERQNIAKICTEKSKYTTWVRIRLFFNIFAFISHAEMCTFYAIFSIQADIVVCIVIFENYDMLR